MLNLLQCCFSFLSWFFRPGGMQYLSSPTRDGTHNPCPGRRSPRKSLTQYCLVRPTDFPGCTSVFQWPLPSSRMPVLPLWCFNLDPCAWAHTQPWPLVQLESTRLLSVELPFPSMMNTIAEGGGVLESLHTFRSSYYENFHSKSRENSYDGPHSLTKIY